MDKGTLTEVRRVRKSRLQLWFLFKKYPYIFTEKKGFFKIAILSRFRVCPE
jgi:hypothetical protein